jgi:hypothetical protein
MLVVGCYPTVGSVERLDVAGVDQRHAMDALVVGAGVPPGPESRREARLASGDVLSRE